jgi:hypothetical protein
VTTVKLLREWFVSYDVTERTIVLHHSGDDPVNITPGEAEGVSDDLRAAILAEHEHRILRGED